MTAARDTMRIEDVEFTVRRSDRRRTIGITVPREGPPALAVPTRCRPSTIERAVRAPAGVGAAEAGGARCAPPASAAAPLRDRRAVPAPRPGARAGAARRGAAAARPVRRADRPRGREAAAARRALRAAALAGGAGARGVRPLVPAARRRRPERARRPLRPARRRRAADRRDQGHAQPLGYVPRRR